jgi:hypothetical protein
MSLREHIKCHDRVKRISGIDEFLEIASERGRVAGDV